MTFSTMCRKANNYLPFILLLYEYLLRRNAYLPSVKIAGPEANDYGVYQAIKIYGFNSFLHAVPISKQSRLPTVVSAILCNAVSVKKAWWLVMSTFENVINLAITSSCKISPEWSSKNRPRSSSYTSSPG